MNALKQRIFSMVDREHLPHGLLFVGPRNSPKESVAMALAQKLVCPSDTDPRPCQTCAACRNVLEHNHPDVRTLLPEKQEITIEQVRDLQRWIHIGPYEAKRKVGLIHEAHALNIAAANALLKTLEEPPAHAILILSTTSPDQLPRTVHSRLMMVRFPEDPSLLPSEEVLPDWIPELEALLTSPQQVSPDHIFDLTQRLSKERGELRFFFASFERHLRDQLVQAQAQSWPSFHIRKMEDLFDETLRIEHQLLRRYSNIGLNLDRLLLNYNSLYPR